MLHSSLHSAARRAIRPAAILALSLVTFGCELTTFSEDAARKGNTLYNQQNYTDAAGAFQNAVRQRPDNYKAHYMLGQSYEQLNQTQKAIAAYKAARDTRWETLPGIQDTATADKVFDGLARTIAKTEDKDIEITLLKQHATTARNGDDYIILARIFRAAGDPDSAVAAYDQAITRYPREQWYALEYGRYLKSLGLPTRAQAVLSNALKTRPNADITKELAGLQAQ